MSSFSTWLYTKLFGQFVGKDEFGNSYYQTRNYKRAFNRPERWVYFNGIPEASKVPPQWFGWLHYQTNNPPASNSKKYNWEKSHRPNLTGTTEAYYPKGHLLGDKVRAKAVGDYEAWRP